MASAHIPQEKWLNAINSLQAIMDREAMLLLRSCTLSRSKGQWILFVPNKFALDKINEKYLSSVLFALQKQDVPQIETRLGETQQNLFTQRKQSNDFAPTFNSRLNPHYQFENFIVGKSNDNAYAAVHRVSKGLLSEDFNPLLIYGGTGLGKSHLMHAAGNALCQNGKKRVMYLTAEEFTNDYINAIKNPKREMSDFINFYRNADALLIDDVQFLSGKNRSQEEFFHTFNSLFDKKRQIILTCDRFPKEIEGLADRLKSRFGSGLTVSVAPPDYETRIAILQSKAERLHFSLPKEVEEYIAEKVTSNIRDLEGALRKVYAYCEFNHEIITLDIARNALNDLIQAQNCDITIDHIRTITATHFNISVEDMDSKKRMAAITLPRQIAMHLAKSLTQHSYPEIGKIFGKRDHSTVIHACRKIDELLQENESFYKEYNVLKMRIMGS